MRVEESRVDVCGRLLRRVVLRPDDVSRERAAMIFYHGQGDFAARYQDVLHPFTERGIRCVLTDLPGHGYSPGVRGHAGDEEMLDAVVRDACAETGGLPCGVGGHSMGGLLAARHLLMAGEKGFPAPAFAWLSSPLLKPSVKLPGWQIKLIGWLAPLIPQLTIATGVTREACQTDTAQEASSEETPILTRPVFQPWHGRISIGWGSFLMDCEKEVAACVSRGTEFDLPPVLLTHGTDDPVCPPIYSVEFAELLGSRLEESRVSHYEIEGMRHEPFSGPGNEMLFRLLDEWLDGVEATIFRS